MGAGCHRAAGLLVVVALAAIASGCGGSSAPTKATYGKNVDKLCATLDDRVSAIQKKAPQTTDELVAFADELQKVIDDGVASSARSSGPTAPTARRPSAWIKELTRAEGRGDQARAGRAQEGARRTRTRPPSSARCSASSRSTRRRSTSSPATPARAPAATPT